MAEFPRNGTEPFMSVKDMVIEIRADVKELKEAVQALSHVPTQVEDHEDRLRTVERRVWGIPGGLLVAILAALGIQQS